MISFESILKICKYQVADGGEFLWTCYGRSARYLICTGEYATVDMIFDSNDQTVFEVQIASNDDGSAPSSAYRWNNPDYLQAYHLECKERNINPYLQNDDEKFIVIENEQDFLKKLEGIFDGTDFDQHPVVTLQLTDSEHETLVHMASTLDITIDQLVERILREAIPEK